MRYFNITTYGCTANQNNSEILAGMLTSAGYQLTNNPKIADILIINTCIVKQKTEDKIKRKIQDLTKLYPKKLLIIAGCMPETDAKHLKQLFPNSILLGTHHFKDIIKLLKNQLTEKKQKEYLAQKNEEKLLSPKIPFNKLISITQISEGCLGNCTYCKARIAKGKLFSYDINNIIKSIENDLQNGAKEIWLTSQDLASYNLDKNQTSQLPELLNKILSLKHIFKLRLGMCNPNHILPILDELTEIYKNKKIYKFLHIPIQSASNQILEHMNRYYTIKDIELIINKFKQEIPDITIATDIIVGYPTETEQTHQQNLSFINKFKPDVLNLSKFSSHKNTRAGSLKQLPINIINKRTSELMSAHRQTAQQNKQKFLNQTLKVFVNKKTDIPDVYEARDENYNIVLIKSDDKTILGRTIKAKIIMIGVHHMIGEV